MAVLRKVGDKPWHWPTASTSDVRTSENVSDKRLSLPPPRTRGVESRSYPSRRVIPILIAESTAGTNRFSKWVKRSLDWAIVLAVSLVAVPLSLPVALAVSFHDRGPVFSRQQRASVGLRKFDLLVFRRIAPNEISVEETGQVRFDHALVTPGGWMIRRPKIDEMPQLLNVLRGYMSLVGPRPMVPEVVQR